MSHGWFNIPYFSSDPHTLLERLQLVPNAVHHPYAVTCKSLTDARKGCDCRLCTKKSWPICRPAISMRELALNCMKEKTMNDRKTQTNINSMLMEKSGKERNGTMAQLGNIVRELREHPSRERALRPSMTWAREWLQWWISLRPLFLAHVLCILVRPMRTLRGGFPPSYRRKEEDSYVFEKPFWK